MPLSCWTLGRTMWLGDPIFTVRDGGCLIPVSRSTTRKKHSFIGFFMFIGADVHILNYVRRFKAPWPLGRPTRLWSSADVSARQTQVGIVPGPALSCSRFSLSRIASTHAAATAKSPHAAAPAMPCPGPHRPAPAGAACCACRTPALSGRASPA
jgi:hypothetical protein